MQREPNTEYILSLSYGKDSIACLEAIKQLNYPLDRIVHAEVWATDTIPADLPPMVEFKSYADKVIKNRYGIDVEHICAVRGVRNSLTKSNSMSGLTRKETKIESMDSLTHSERGAIVDSKLAPCQKLEKITYEKLFYHIPKRKDSGGEQTESNNSILGFPIQRGTWCNSNLKIAALRISNINRQRELVYNAQNKVFSSSAIAQGAKKNIVQYLGIAADEPERIKRHSISGKILPLVDIGWDEAYCRKWCEDNNLLSPIYTDSLRGGCWFCHNQSIEQLRLLRKKYPELWNLLLKWDSDSPTTFKSDGHTVHDFDRRFQAEDDGLIKAGDRKFRWKDILTEE